MSRLEGSISQGAQASCSESASPLFTSCLEEEFSETDIQYYVILYVRTGAKGHLPPVACLRSRHLDTPPHKNSLAVSEKTSSRQFGELILDRW